MSPTRSEPWSAPERWTQGDISAPGSSYITALYRYSAYREDTENYGIVRGGMGGITQAMARSAQAHGVSIRTDAEVRRILTEKGRATGVELTDGETIEADVVVSNADPKRTFLTLLNSAALDNRLPGRRQGPEDRVRLGKVPLRPEGAARFLGLSRLGVRSDQPGHDRHLPLGRLRPA